MEVRAPAYITERIIFQFPPLFICGVWKKKF